MNSRVEDKKKNVRNDLWRAICNQSRLEKLYMDTKDVDKEISRRKMELSKLDDIYLFDKEPILRAITKLVSNIDGVNYDLRSVSFGDYGDVFYLVNELDEFSVRLAYCDKEAKRIDFSNNVLELKKDSSHGYCSIDNEDYLYILDFIEKVVTYKVLKVDYDVCYEELEQLIYSFIPKYNSKKYAKNRTLKTS